MVLDLLELLVVLPVVLLSDRTAPAPRPRC